MRSAYLVMLLFLAGCFKAPTATMTDQYIEVANPGQTLGLIKIKVDKVDTTFGYPLEEQSITSYTIVQRASGKQLYGSTGFKIYFNRRYRKYQWRVRKDPFLADYYDSDTIQLEPYTWYRLTTEKYGFHVYFYWNKEEGTYVQKLKPKPGAW